MNNLQVVKQILPPMVDANGRVLSDESVVEGIVNLEHVLDYIDISEGYRDMEDASIENVTRITYYNGLIRDVLISLYEFNKLMLNYQNSRNKWIVRSKLN